MTKPAINHAIRMRAVRPGSQLFATSCAANESGKKTDRIPWVNHLSGKIAAKFCIQEGNWVKTKNTPLKNCKMMTIGETTADAPRPLFGTTEKAMPKIVELAIPSTIIQRNVSHFSPVAGSEIPYRATPNARRSPT